MQTRQTCASCRSARKWSIWFDVEYTAFHAPVNSTRWGDGRSEGTQVRRDGVSGATSALRSILVPAQPHDGPDVSFHPRPDVAPNIVELAHHVAFDREDIATL